MESSLTTHPSLGAAKAICCSCARWLKSWRFADSSSAEEIFSLMAFSARPEEDATLWLDNYLEIAKYNGWDENECLWNFGESLKGSASNWFACVKSRGLGWERLTKAFLETFRAQDSESLWLSQLQERKQHEGEPPLNYFHDVMRICDKLDKNMQNKTKLTYLSRGLENKTKQEFPVFKCLN